MTFEEVLPMLKAGKKIYLRGLGYYLDNGNVRKFDVPSGLDFMGLEYKLKFEDILSDDWKIFEKRS